MKLLVTGTTGFVGNKIRESYAHATAAPSLQKVTQEMVERMVEESEADVVLHTAAISDIGICQKNPEASYFANVQIPVYLAHACKVRKLICFSSDQVYSACEEDGPYTEEVVKPGNIYAEHKLEMEERVLDLVPSAVMLRAEWMYDYISQKPNYFLNMLHAEQQVSFSSRQFRGITYLIVAAYFEEAVWNRGIAYISGAVLEVIGIYLGVCAAKDRKGRLFAAIVKIIEKNRDI